MADSATSEARAITSDGTPPTSVSGEKLQFGGAQPEGFSFGGAGHVGPQDASVLPYVTSAEAVPCIVPTPDAISPEEQPPAGDLATNDHATANHLGWRRGEIMRLLGIVDELRRDLAASEASQRDLRRMNQEYAARVGNMPLQDQAAQARLIELAEVRREAAAHAGDADALREELASLRRSAEEAEAARAAREEQGEIGERAEAAEAIERARSETERLGALNAALDREIVEERQRCAAAEAKAADAAAAALRAEASATEALQASEALHAELQGQSARGDALDRRAAVLQDERDRLRSWYDVVTGMTRWHLMGRPGGRLETLRSTTAR